MSSKSNIEWTDHTWSPWDGCTKVSPGCANCYAEARDKRHLIEDVDHWGEGAPRRLRLDWKSPVKWNREAICKKCGKSWPARGMHPDCDGEGHDFRRQRVFPSLCDWLDDEVPPEWLARFLGLIHDTPNLDWLLLTKRPENFDARTLAACQLLSESMTAATAPMVRWLIDWRRGFEAPRNVWLGTSVEDQTRTDERIPAFLKIQARVRFLSVEPLLGPIKFSMVPGFNLSGSAGVDLLKNLWVIVGGESGKNARPCNIDWVRSIVKQCQGASVPCFVKQLGARPVVTATRGQAMPDDFRAFSHPKCGDPAEWPDDLRVRQFPEVKL